MKDTSSEVCMTQDERIDERMRLRIERLEREKERQNRKHQRKIENTDWLSKLNKEEDYDRRSENK